MIVVLAYDVGTVDRDGPRRLRRIAKTCESFGIRVQRSVFECRVGPVQWVKLRHRLLSAMDPTKDSLRFYFIDDDSAKKTEHHGVREPTDPEGPLVF